MRDPVRRLFPPDVSPSAIVDQALSTPMIDENTLIHLCRTHFDRYANVVEGNVALAIEFSADGTPSCGVCGVGLAEGGYFSVHRQAYVSAMGPVKQEAPPLTLPGGPDTPIADDPVVARSAPRTVYEGEELRIVLSGAAFVMEVPRLDAMRATVWEQQGACEVEGLGVDARACRALLRLQEYATKLERSGMDAAEGDSDVTPE